jgi:hypothetical protein
MDSYFTASRFLVQQDRPSVTGREPAFDATFKGMKG